MRIAGLRDEVWLMEWGRGGGQSGGGSGTWAVWPRKPYVYKKRTPPYNLADVIVYCDGCGIFDHVTEKKCSLSFQDSNGWVTHVSNILLQQQRCQPPCQDRHTVAFLGSGPSGGFPRMRTLGLFHIYITLLLHNTSWPLSPVLGPGRS